MSGVAETGKRGAPSPAGGPRSAAPHGRRPIPGRRGAARRAGRGVVLLAVGAMLASGCASMPGGGDVQRVDQAVRSDGDSQVRVFGVSPQQGAQPEQIVRGFLEAVTSDEADFATAREYLTQEADAAWRPSAGTSVLSDGPGLPAEPGESSPDGSTVRFEISGERLAVVDEQHVYRPDDGTHRAVFELSRVDEEWRIADLPDGLILGEQDFLRIYRSVSTYFYAAHSTAAVATPQANSTLVADPIYLRHRVDLVGEAVKALLSGPSEWLEPVVRSQFPDEVALVPGARPVVDEEGVLTVRLTGLPAAVQPAACSRMAAQLYYTVRDLGTSEVTEVRVSGGSGAICALTAGEARDNAPGLLIGEQDRQYFIDDDSRVTVVQDEDDPRAVAGPLGRGEVALRSVAVARDGRRAAAVSADGASLYIDALSGTDSLGAPVHTAPGGGPEDGISSPSWDGLGDLWFVDRGADGPRVMRMTGGTGTASEVEVAGLGGGRTVEALRVASDGVRIALLVRDEEDRTTLQLGRIERWVDEEQLQMRVEGLRPVAPHLENVVAVAWAGGSRLVVVGRPPGGAEQMSYVNTDGSTVNATSVAGPSEITGVAASEQEEQPLLARSGDGIARQHQDGTWRIVSPEGTSPAYPG